MPMNISDKIVILHQGELQGHIWEKILQSQGLQSVILPFSVDLKGELTELARMEQPLPSLILLEQQLPSFDASQFCQWVRALAQPVPVILIAPQTRKVNLADREAAIAMGATDLLPQFDLNSIAIEAVGGLKAVAKILGNINIVNSTLVTCIMDLKRELEHQQLKNQQKIPVPPPIPPMPLAAPPPLPQPTTTPTDESPSSKPRKYRGRDY